MRCSFVQFGDVHLGTQQYDCPERLNDFGRAWQFACEYVANARPDFAVCTGDLFNRFTINPITFDQAYSGLSLLREAGVRLVDIQGNHDRTRYGEARNWLDTLADQGLLTHLDVVTGSEGVRLLPVEANRHAGSFVEWSGCRIVGVRYLGASTERVLREIEPKLADFGDDGLFTILVVHAGVEGIVPGINAELSNNAVDSLRERANYLALGHLHKHYTLSNFAYNGGSLETWALNEWGWKRGLLHVEIDTSRPQPISFRLIDVPRRPFAVVRVDVNEFENPRALLRGCYDALQAEHDRLQANGPVVALSLKGRLRFDQQSLPVDQLENACREIFNPLIALVREDYDTGIFVTEGGDDTDAPVDRAVLERDILRARLAEDERYAPHAAQLAALATELKERALRGADGQHLLATFRGSLQRLDGTTVTAESAYESVGVVQ
ncbi:MAG TPA: metallophosphoesterase [Chloroflexota bacterium]|nr:metallophosphoesterase [Chloroflexota bacterium]